MCRAPMPSPSWRRGDGQRLQQGVEVGQRLAHAHDDDVRQPFLGRQQVAGVDQLFEDLAGRQVADDAVEAAGAEDAAHAAADLRADAGRAPVCLLDQHAFDQLAVVQAQQQLVRAVAGIEVPGDVAAERSKLRGQFVAQMLAADRSFARTNRPARRAASGASGGRSGGCPRACSQASISSDGTSSKARRSSPGDCE